MGDGYQIRPACPADAEALSLIERRCFSDPWSEQGFREALGSPGGFGLVAEGPRGIQGYLLGRKIVAEGEVLNLAVRPDRRRQGVGATLLGAGLAHFGAHGIREVFLEVRASNQAARRLYQARGFVAVAQRPRYYRNPPEDALVLRLRLDRPA